MPNNEVVDESITRSVTSSEVDTKITEQDSPCDKDAAEVEVKKRKKENKTLSVMEKLTKSLKESDNVMLQLEEKRMKLMKN